MMIVAYFFFDPTQNSVRQKSEKELKKSCWSIIKLKETTIVQFEYNYHYAFMTLTINKILNKDNKPFDEIISHYYKNKGQCNDKNCNPFKK